MTLFSPRSKVLIVDGNSFFYRSYFATLKLIESANNPNTKGLESNALFTSIRMLEKFLDDYPNYLRIFFTWDAGKKTFRHLSYSQYKANRKKTPEKLIQQIPLYEKFLNILKIQYFKNIEYEADDLISSITKKSLIKELAVDIISSDQDLLQIVQPHVRLFLLKSGVKKINIVDSDNFQSKFDLEPWQIVDYKVLVGDKSDNLPGVNGIGKKRALMLLKRYHNLENIYKNVKDLPQFLQTNLIKFQKNCFFLKKLIKLNDKLDINPCFDQQIYNFQSFLAQQFYRKHKMFSLVKINKQNKFNF